MYTHLVLGGTFDHFHVGHRHLLAKAATLSSHITIGLTLPSLHRNKEYAHAIESFAIREKNIREFLHPYGDLRLEIIPIDSIYGTTLTDPTFDAIVVSAHTRANAEIINMQRQDQGLAALTIEECALLVDESGQVISSTRIRKGEINRAGQIYDKVFQQILIFDDETKVALRVPLGVWTAHFSPIPDAQPIFLIGDVTTDTFIQQKHYFTAAYIDGISKRKPYQVQVNPPYTLESTAIQNPPGTIAPDAMYHMKNIGRSRRNYVYSIQGEEDLLACCAILLLPLGSTVVYGQAHPVSGLIQVKVTEEIKDHIYHLLSTLKHDV